MAAATSAPAQPLSLRANFSWTLAGNVVYAGCQWAMLAALAKLGSAEELGRFALGLAVTAPLFMFANLQLRSIQATDARREIPFGDCLRLRARTSAAAFALSCAIAWLAFAPQTALVVSVLAAAKAAESFSDVIYGLHQQHEQMDRIARSLVWRGALALLCLAAGVGLGHRAVWGAAGMLVAWVAVLLLRDLPDGALVEAAPPDARTPADRARALRRLARLGLPLGVVMLLVSLNANLPRYFLERSRGPAELGIFAAIASALVAGAAVVNALGQSASPRLARLAALGDREGSLALLRRLVGVGAGLGAAGVAAAASVGRPALALLFTPEYARHSAVLVTVMVAAGIAFVASFLGYAMTALRAFRAQVPLFLAACGVTAGWAAFDIPRSGLQGAARALVASALVQSIGSAWVVSRALPARASR